MGVLFLGKEKNRRVVVFKKIYALLVVPLPTYPKRYRIITVMINTTSNMNNTVTSVDNIQNSDINTAAIITTTRSTIRPANIGNITM